MTPVEFRAAHGDPADWCGPEIDEYLDGCLAALPAPQPPSLHLLLGGTPRAGKTLPPTANAA